MINFPDHFLFFYFCPYFKISKSVIRISNISFFRFCQKNRKLGWPKCARTPTGFTNSNSTIFHRVTNLKLQFLTYSCRFIYLTFTNTSKHGQNDEIRHSSFRSSKPHEVKSTDMRCILTTNINICRGENTTRRKKCQIFASAMYSSYQAGVSPEGGLEVGQTL